MNQHTFQQLSIHDPIGFWKNVSKDISWYKKPQEILTQRANGYADWFVDGKLNMSYLCLDYHIEQGRGHDIALYWDSPVTNQKREYTFLQLRNDVAKFAGGLHKLGLEKGDRAVIYMPMIPEAIIAMLACARIGITHSVVFGGFAAHELAIRIDDCKPEVLITANYGIEINKQIPYLPIIESALEHSKHQPKHTIVHYRKTQFPDSYYQKGLNFNDLIQQPLVHEPVWVESTHPLYLLYTSGTTGKPKGVQRDTGGYATALKFAMKEFYNAQEGDVFFSASDLGWVVGHSFIAYGPLIHGCSTVLYEGKPIKTPDAGAFWRLVSQYQINQVFAAPTAIRAIKKEDPNGEFYKKYDTSSLKYFFLAGERCDITTYQWLHELIERPVIDHWWQTESGWPMLGMMQALDLPTPKAGSAGKPVCGFNIQILDEAGQELPEQSEGFIAIKLPLPPGCLQTLWEDEQKFQESYLDHFPGYYTSGDGGYKDSEGYFYVMGRVDDVINVAGHRLSTGEMEEIIGSHQAIAECAVVGVDDALKGQIPVAIVVTKEGFKSVDIQTEIVQLIRHTIGAIACLKLVYIAQRLPKTRSGKVLRKTMRLMLEHKHYEIPSTIEDIHVLAELKELFTPN
jgi:acyl-coenzyme A synthetase/AMP-(fatty) acid ligase